MHLSRRFAHCPQTWVCPHGKTTGARSVRLRDSKQITQWNENGALDSAVIFVVTWRGDLAGCAPIDAIPKMCQEIAFTVILCGDGWGVSCLFSFEKEAFLMGSLLDTLRKAYLQMLESCMQGEGCLPRLWVAHLIHLHFFLLNVRRTKWCLLRRNYSHTYPDVRWATKLANDVDEISDRQNKIKHSL